MKKVKLFFAVSVASAVLSMTSFAGECKQDASGWWYQNDDGSYPTNTWKEINGKQYYFDNNGYILTNTSTPDGQKVDASGALITPLFSFDTDDAKITYTGWKLASDYDGYSCVILYYDFTNKIPEFIIYPYRQNEGTQVKYASFEKNEAEFKCIKKDSDNGYYYRLYPIN